MSKQKRYRCPKCGALKSKEEGCVCEDCAEILIADANREMFGDEADWMEAAGIDDIGDK